MDPKPTTIDTLSRRELEIAEAYIGGENYRQIAKRLCIAPTTVRSHLQTIYRKLGVSSKIELLHTLESGREIIGPPALSKTTSSLRGTERPGNNVSGKAVASVPLVRTRLIGRALVLSEIERTIAREEVGLVTLTGPGGAGKTRIALEVAKRMAGAFRSGVSFVELSEIRDPRLVTAMMARVLDLQTTRQRSYLEALSIYLADKEMLVVLDNFEQVLPAACDVSSLMSACERLKILITSRAPLQIRGEHEYPVPPLALPSLNDRHDPARLQECPAVQLFVERAKAIRPNFALNEENTETIADICIRLDGLPLALELAAARVRMLDPGSILERLNLRLPLLVGGSRDLPERQRTLRTTIEWSYALLSPRDQHLFDALSIFAGGCNIKTIESVLSTLDASSTDQLDAIESLQAMSLLRRASDVHGQPRFYMLETLREFGLERLELRGQRNELARCHAAYFCNFAREANTKLKAENQLKWLDLVDADHSNLRAALAWSLTANGDPALGLCIAANLVWFWRLRGHIGEARDWIEPLLTLCPERTLSRAQALWGLTLMIAGDGPADSPSASYAVEAMSIAREFDDNISIAWALHAHGRVLHARRTLAQAYDAFDESLQRFERDGDQVGCAYSSWKMGSVAREMGNLVLARRYIDQATRFAKRSGDIWSIASTIMQAGTVELSDENFPEAVRNMKDSLRHYQAIKARWGMWFPFVRLIIAAGRQGHWLRAAKLAGIEEAIREATSSNPDISEGAMVINVVAESRAMLGGQAFSHAFDEGKSMWYDRALEYACSDEDESQGARSQAHSALLSPANPRHA